MSREGNTFSKNIPTPADIFAGVLILNLIPLMILLERKI